MSQNFPITIGETRKCITCHATKSPKIFKDFAFILPLEEISREGKKTRKNSHEKKTHLGNSCVTMKYLMDKFDEKTELSDVICEKCTLSSLTISKTNKKKQLVLKSPMKLRISLQYPILRMKKTNSAKIKQK